MRYTTRSQRGFAQYPGYRVPRSRLPRFALAMMGLGFVGIAAGALTGIAMRDNKLPVVLSGHAPYAASIAPETVGSIRRYDPLIDPNYVLGPAPAPFGHRLPLAGTMRPLPQATARAQEPAIQPAIQPAPVPSIVTAALPAAPVAPEEEETQAVPTPLQRPSAVLGAPMPMPRPPELRAPPVVAERPAAPQPPTRAERRGRADAIAAAPPPDNRNFFERLLNLRPVTPNGPVLAYAPSDGGLGNGRSLNDAGGNAPRITMPIPNRAPPHGTAIYDIRARTVYLPSGERLEAHSGLGERMDDPRHAHVRMHGPTPPHVYDLTEREQRFHGVRAIRLNPVGGSRAIHGRAGLLAHTYLLGPRGDSNGCLSIRDYDRFLQAFLRGEVRRLVVVAGT